MLLANRNFLFNKNKAAERAALIVLFLGSVPLDLCLKLNDLLG